MALLPSTVAVLGWWLFFGRDPTATAVLACGTACAPPSWQVVLVHIIAGLSLWGALLLVGLAVALCTRWRAPPRGFHERLERHQRRLDESVPYRLVRLGLGFVLSCFFGMRTYTKSLSDFEWALELLVCLVQLHPILLGWLRAFIEGTRVGVRFLCTSATLDTFLTASAIASAIPLEGGKSWVSLSFFAASHIASQWAALLRICDADKDALVLQALDAGVQLVSVTVFAASGMILVEELGDPAMFSVMNQREWNMVSALYYTVSTLATVGYRGMAPTTVLGRLFAVAAVLSGIAFVMVSVNKLNKLVELHSSGGATYVPGTDQRYVVVLGNPSAEAAQEFILEMFHPDHADDGDGLHVVFLLPRGTGVPQALARFKERPGSEQFRDRVHIFQGSVLNPADIDRVKVLGAECAFILPNMQCAEPVHEDTENIIRCMALTHASPDLRVIMMLLRAESQTMVERRKRAGPDVTCIIMDQIKLGLVGKTSDVPGFVPLICNLVKCVGEGDDEEQDENDDDDEGDTTKNASWQRDYERGLGNELYEIPLSDAYTDREALFTQVLLDVLARTDGTVHLIGLVEMPRRAGLQKRVLINPGPKYPIAPEGFWQTSGIFIAPDREAVVQCVDPSEDLLCGDRPPLTQDEEETDWDSVRDEPLVRRSVTLRASVETRGRGTRQEGEEEEEEELPAHDVDPRLLGVMRGPQRHKAKQLVALSKRRSKALYPPKPPTTVLAKGGHILFVCTGVGSTTDLRIGAEHFVSPLRQASTSKKGSVETPVVVMAPVVPHDWESVTQLSEVYFLKGSPLSEYDLDRANASQASVIFVCNIGNMGAIGNVGDAWAVDSEAVRCTRLVEAKLQPNAETVVVAEILAASSYTWLPIRTEQWRARSRLSAWSHLKSGLIDEAEEGMFERAESLIRSTAQTVHEELQQLRKVNHEGHNKSNEYNLHPRFASGQLFVGGILISLVANTFFNPSLNDMVMSMVSTNASAIKVPTRWVGKTYAQFLTHLFWGEGSLGVGLIRWAEQVGQERKSLGKRSIIRKTKDKLGNDANERHWAQRFPFVYTAPPASDTILVAGDRILCFGRSRLV